MLSSAMYKPAKTDIPLAQSVVENLNKTFKEYGSFFITMNKKEITRLSFDAKSMCTFFDFSVKLKEFAKLADMHIHLDRYTGAVLNMFEMDDNFHDRIKNGVIYHIDKPTNKLFEVISRCLVNARRECEESKVRASIY